MKIQRMLFALMLLVAYPAIADTAARAETLPGAARQSLQQQLYRAANEANDPDVMYLTGLMFDRGEGCLKTTRKPTGGTCLPRRPVSQGP
jgi:TPR repeat protein